MVLGQSPQCGDYSVLNQLLNSSFYNNFVLTLCRTDYQYYISQNPTKYFYTLDLVGYVNGAEKKYKDWIGQVLLNTWISKYPGNLLKLF